jgi:hypothetical protein
MNIAVTCPLLVLGRDFVPQGKWPVVMTKLAKGNLGRDYGATFHFYSSHRLLARLQHAELTLLKCYASDGYSPVIRLPFGKFLRLTPTPKCGMWPALGHDLTRQFLDVVWQVWRQQPACFEFSEHFLLSLALAHLSGW